VQHVQMKLVREREGGVRGGDGEWGIPDLFRAWAGGGPAGRGAGDGRPRSSVAGAMDKQTGDWSSKRYSISGQLVYADTK
jgi:hypothetical protein